jgi:predicted PolB exonuclease-like 3'-5' exonuclease
MIIYLDTETVPSSRLDVAEHYAAKHYDADDIAKAAKKAAADLDKTSLSGLFGELAVISWANDNDEPCTLVRNFSRPDGEREMLEAFAECDIDGDVIVAHNAEFDRNMIRQRAIVHGVKLPKRYAATDVKPWESCWACTMAMWCDSRQGRVSLDDLCLAFGLPGKGVVDGSMVAGMVRAGRIDEVAAYCADDVRRVRAIYQRMTR